MLRDKGAPAAYCMSRQAREVGPPVLPATSGSVITVACAASCAYAPAIPAPRNR